MIVIFLPFFKHFKQMISMSSKKIIRSIWKSNLNLKFILRISRKYDIIDVNNKNTKESYEKEKQVYKLCIIINKIQKKRRNQRKQSLAYNVIYVV